MIAWFSANLINITLVVVIVMITALLIRSMIHDNKTGRSSCGCNCASCGTCSGCSACGRCGTVKSTTEYKFTNSVSGDKTR